MGRPFRRMARRQDALKLPQAPELAEPLGAAAKGDEDGLLERRRFHFPAKRRDDHPAAAD